MTIVPGNCPRCGGYKRGIDGRCAHCNARWPDNEPAPRVLDLGDVLIERFPQAVSLWTGKAKLSGGEIITLEAFTIDGRIVIVKQNGKQSAYAWDVFVPGIDGRCAHCNARWPDNEPAPRVLDLMAALKEALKQNPAAARTATGRGTGAEESPASVPNVDPAREGSNA